LKPREVDSCLFPVRGLEQRRLAFDWNRSCGANENATGAADPFFREAVSTHGPVFLNRRLPPSSLSFAAPCTARRKDQATHPCWSESWNRRPSGAAKFRIIGITAPEGRRCMVSGARCVSVSVRSPQSVPSQQV